MIRGNEATATEFSRIIIPSGSAIAAMSYLIINSTTFTFSRTSAEDSLPLMSRLLISPVNRGLNRAVMNCVDVETSEAASTIIELTERPVQGRLHLLILDCLWMELLSTPWFAMIIIMSLLHRCQ